ncbi:hypothetical protein ILYODFUR_014198, partial [Ilyodon furcidens]
RRSYDIPTSWVLSSTIDSPSADPATDRARGGGDEPSSSTCSFRVRREKGRLRPNSPSGAQRHQSRTQPTSDGDVTVACE